METRRERPWTLLGVMGGFVLAVLILLSIMGGSAVAIPIVVVLIPFLLLISGAWGKRVSEPVVARSGDDEMPATYEDAKAASYRDYEYKEDMVPGSEASDLVGGRLSRTIISGFIASMAMLITFGLAYAAAVIIAGDVGDGTSSRAIMGQWLYNLTHNRVLDLAQNLLYLSIGAHFVMGLLLALIYAYFAEPRLMGAGWVRGVLFSVVPWLFSVAIFFPLVGAGFLGMALGAGPLPLVGNMVLHAVYGAVLGLMYEPEFDRMPDLESNNAENDRAMVHSENLAAKGILIGLFGGLTAGGFIGATVRPEFQTLSISQESTTLMIMLIGGAVGALLGSYFGLPVRNRRLTR